MTECETRCISELRNLAKKLAVAIRSQRLFDEQKLFDHFKSSDRSVLRNHVSCTKNCHGYQPRGIVANLETFLKTTNLQRLPSIRVHPGGQIWCGLKKKQNTYLFDSAWVSCIPYSRGITKTLGTQRLTGFSWHWDKAQPWWNSVTKLISKSYVH